MLKMLEVTGSGDAMPSVDRVVSITEAASALAMFASLLALAQEAQQRLSGDCATEISRADLLLRD